MENINLNKYIHKVPLKRGETMMMRIIQNENHPHRFSCLIQFFFSLLLFLSASFPFIRMLHFESMCLCFNDRNGKKNIFVFFLLFCRSIKKISPHENRILSHSLTHSCGYEKQVVCFKLFFCCLQSIFFRPYNITVSLTPKRRREKKNICDG